MTYPLEKTRKCFMKKLAFLLNFLVVTPLFAIDLFGLDNSRAYEIAYFSTLESQDPDVITALSLGYLKPEDTEHAQVMFTDNTGAKWTLQVFQSKSKPNGPSFFVPHDNENDAFLSGAWALSTYGGHLLSLECAENRECAQGIDPNRHFSDENPIYADTMLAFFNAKPFPVITLHNNHDSHHLLGGEGSIYAGLEIPYTDGRGFYQSGDADDLIIYADIRPYETSPVFRSYNEEFAALGMNSIFEFIDERNALGGHMSTYVIRNTSMEYFNVEAQHGHFEEQKDYLEMLLEILRAAAI